MEAGIPNITGNNDIGFNLIFTDYTKAKGAFFSNHEEIGNACHYGSGTAGLPHSSQLSFDASRCSSVYGGSSTVQPNALTARYYIKF